MTTLQRLDQFALKKFHQAFLRLETKYNFDAKETAMLLSAIMVTRYVFTSSPYLSPTWAGFMTAFYTFTFLFLRFGKERIYDLQLIAGEIRTLCYLGIVVFGFFFSTSLPTLILTECTTDVSRTDMFLRFYSIAGGMCWLSIEYMDFFIVAIIFALVSCIKTTS